ncbi:DUF7007 domain-containing protein [Deinococcus multiflagellatus]|uniref:DUF7007 domain-containing protein n=1 Tax=Deinococcus multiflagellatus TaxID=1656887 RepID=A0ABW1ZQD6_9DEIO|nr:hypothetical protein [Deinococcus multiflagellatus]MBZ9715805.1 hypothetical protein [Deinococcus multiflagellatus]
MPQFRLLHASDPLALVFPSTQGPFQDIAVVTAPSLEAAFALTQHSEVAAEWWTQAGVRRTTHLDARSTSVGDLLVDEAGQVHLVEPLGFRRVGIITPWDSGDVLFDAGEKKALIAAMPSAANPRAGTLSAVTAAHRRAVRQTITILKHGRPLLYACLFQRGEILTVQAAHATGPVTPEDVAQFKTALGQLLPGSVLESVLTRLSTAPGVGAPTPWGPAETSEMVEPGIYRVTAQNHGGYWIDAEVRAVLPSPAQLDDLWYEEDIQAAILAACLGWAEDQPEAAAGVDAIVRQHFPALANYLGGTG